MASEGRILVDKQLARLEKKLHKAYAQAEKDMRQKFNEYTKEFSKKDARLKNLLKKGGITQERYDEWRKAEVYHGKWIKSMIQYYVNEQVTANKRAADMINKALPKMYAESHNFGTFQVEKLAKVDTSYLLYNVDTVARLIEDNPKLLPKASLDVPKDRRWNKQKMTTAVTQGILQGESIPKIAGRLQRVTDMNINTAIRNARTMTTGAENSGKLDSFKRAESMGIRLKKMWSATMDGRTRDSHAFLDGVSIGIDEKFPNGLMYPGDPDGDAGEVYNCRCELSMQLDGFERDRASIFDMNANHFGYESYEEWKKAHGNFEIINDRWQKATAIKHHIVQGENIADRFIRRGEYHYDIDDIVNQQGFDGKPRVVNKEKFDEYAKESEIICQRGYSAKNAEILKKYQDELYNGRWYIDCSNGGAIYGRGMYSVYDTSNRLSDEMHKTAKTFARGGIVETFTMDKSTKFISYEDARYLAFKFNKSFGDRKSPERLAFLERCASEEAKKLKLSGIEKDYLYERVFDLDTNQGSKVVDWYLGLSEKERKLIDDKIMPAVETKRNTDDIRLSSSEVAALYGYDAIKIEKSHYLIVLNRTKVIFRRQ